MNSGTAPAPWLLLGAATPSGAAFLDGLGPVAVELLGRRPPQPLLAAAGRRFRPCDLQQPRSFEGDLSGLLVSFAPIWDLAPFLAALAQDRPHALQGLRGVVACSSSSVISKRFAANRDDRELVRRLGAAEDLLLDTCTALARPARILRPTLIYGSAGGYHDRTLSRLLLAAAGACQGVLLSGRAAAGPLAPALRSRAADGCRSGRLSLGSPPQWSRCRDLSHAAPGPVTAHQP
jgi:hypothetical protein